MEGSKMVPKSEHGNETCTKRETWQLHLNLDQNNGQIHIYLKIFILGTVKTLVYFGPIFYTQNLGGSLLPPKCKFSGKYELHHYSDQDSNVIAKFHVLCMFHCCVLVLAPFLPRYVQGAFIDPRNYFDRK